MYAVVRISGSQFVVREGGTVTVPRLEADPGATVKLEEVLFLRDAKQALVGQPLVPDSFVEAEVIDHPRAKKVTVYKFRRREKYRRKLGHRQLQTRLRIKKISSGA